jgi:segregation and condensation protein A
LAEYRVNLDIFAGPLDLLLYLVRKEEVDIYDIPIARITDQYVRYIEMLKSLDIDLAGDFLVMAATLMQIKSAMLLPQDESEQFQADDLADPRAELIRQLLEYKKFKDAANLLEAVADEHKERFARPDTIIERLKPDAEPEIDIEQVSIWDLLGAFDSICKATGGTLTDIGHIKDDTPIDLYQIEVLHRLQTEGPMSLERIFESRTSRVVMVGLFLALLELIREGLIWAKQPKSSTAIYLRPLTEEPAEEAVQKAILALAESESQKTVQAEQQKQPPIPISEVPAKGKSRVATDMPQTPVQDGPIPITEVSLKSKPAISTNEQEKIKPAKDHR